METELRALLYRQFEGRQVAFNPTEPEPFELVDLTKDITNSTRIYHLRTECVREALEGATLIVADSQALANTVRQVLSRKAVVTLPFGPMRTAGRIEAGNLLRVGLLNHSGEMEMNNAYARPILKNLSRKLLVYGRELPGIEAETIPPDQFELFCGLCDILLLPSLPGAINSITLPLAAMASGNVAILAHNAPGYYELDAATGVQLLPNDPATWWLMLDILEAQPTKLRTMQERNRAFAQRLNRESYSRLAALVTQFTASVAPVSEGCGCSSHTHKSTNLEKEFS